MWKNGKAEEPPIFGRFSEFDTVNWQIWATCKICPKSKQLDPQQLISNLVIYQALKAFRTVLNTRIAAQKA